MQNEIDQKSEWETPVVVDLDVKNTEKESWISEMNFSSSTGIVWGPSA